MIEGLEKPPDHTPSVCPPFKAVGIWPSLGRSEEPRVWKTVTEDEPAYYFLVVKGGSCINFNEKN